MWFCIDESNISSFANYSPEALVLVGEIGLIMLLLEAGVELDVAQLKETGLRAIAIGATGTILPLAVGMGLAMASGPNVTVSSSLVMHLMFRSATQLLSRILDRSKRPWL